MARRSLLKMRSPWPRRRRRPIPAAT